MTRRYHIELSPPRRARDDLARLWRENLHLESDPVAKFRWSYEEVPIRPEGVFLISLETGEERRAVGSAGVWTREFLVDGRPVRAALLADLSVDRRFRTALPAIRLVREARRYVRDRFEFAYGFPNDSAIAVFRRCGYQVCGDMVRYVRLLRHREFLERASRGALAARLGAPLADASALARRSPRTAAARIGYKIEWQSGADERIDMLWDRAATHYRVIGRRNSGFVNWRLLRQPGRQCRLATLVSRRTGQVRAYAAVQFHEQVAHVRDFFGHPQDLAPLFELVSRAARRAGAVSVSVRFFGDARPIAALRAAGFRPRSPHRVMIVEPDADRCVADPSSWFSTDADEDN